MDTPVRDGSEIIHQICYTHILVCELTQGMTLSAYITFWTGRRSGRAHCHHCHDKCAVRWQLVLLSAFLQSAQCSQSICLLHSSLPLDHTVIQKFSALLLPLY
jgi:hypothetical protein